MVWRSCVRPHRRHQLLPCFTSKLEPDARHATSVRIPTTPTFEMVHRAARMAWISHGFCGAGTHGSTAQRSGSQSENAACDRWNCNVNASGPRAVPLIHPFLGWCCGLQVLCDWNCSAGSTNCGAGHYIMPVPTNCKSSVAFIQASCQLAAVHTVHAREHTGSTMMQYTGLSSTCAHLVHL